MPLPADTPVKVEQPCPSPLLYTALRQAAESNPGLVFVCAPLIKGEPQRDSLLRAAFLTAIDRDPALAARQLPQLLNRPWIADSGFFSILTFARTYPKAGRELLILAATRYPDVALRDDLPIDVFEAAVKAAPDEAVGVACGNSPTGQRVLGLLRDSPSAQLQILAHIAGDPKLSLPVRQRMAVFSAEIAAGRITIDQAIQASTESRYFGALANLRLSAAPAEIPMLDRVLSTYAEILFRTIGDAPPQLSARDVYLLLTYGRTEEDDASFAAVFDRLLMPRMHSLSTQKLLEQAHDLNLRPFLTTAIAHQRLDAFLAKAGAPAAQAQVLARCFTRLESVDDMIGAAEILDAIQDSERLRALKDVVLDQYHRAGQNQPLYGLLAASLGRKLDDPALQAIALGYAPYLRQPRSLDTDALFDQHGVCIQQHIFYDDDDAHESFDSFQQTYTHDPQWHWQDRGWYVTVTGQGQRGRQIEIYANVPHATPGADDRRQALTKLLIEQGRTPSMVVHRGHTWYVTKSLEYLTPSARLVFLGSCRGLENSYSVLALANRAQLISTRGIGTTSINDALLRAINDQLLTGAKTLDWEQFWRSEQAKLGANPMFRDYIPPSRNTAAIMLAAYYEYLAAL